MKRNVHFGSLLDEQNIELTMLCAEVHLHILESYQCCSVPISCIDIISVE